MDIELKFKSADSSCMEDISEAVAEPSEKYKNLENIKIGSLCSECSNPTEKVMQSYVFDLENIIGLGMYEKAEIATEVLMEREDDPIETGLKKVFPNVEKAIIKYEKKLLSKVELMKTLQAADIAMNVLKKSSGSEWDKTACGGWHEFLKKASEDYCDFLLP